MSTSTPASALSRRAFLSVAGAGIATAALAACSSGGGSSSSGGTLKFWNMPWGGTRFNPLDKKITLAYKPAKGLPSATYQEIQWSNFNQTFASAVASNTGPAVSSGGGTQAFQFAKQGKIAYADNLIESWKSNGLYDDFLPGLLDAMKTAQGYVAIPYNLDMRVLWYNKTLLAKAGATPPTNWQSYLDAAAALIQALEGFDARARDALIAELSSRQSATTSYIDEHVDRLGDSLIDLLVYNSGDIAVDVLRSLQLLHVTVQPDHADEDEVFATFDYSISPDETDAILTVSFDVRGDVVAVETQG